MADIKHYQQYKEKAEKNKMEQSASDKKSNVVQSASKFVVQNMNSNHEDDQEDYKLKIKRHKRKVALIAAAIAIAVIGLILFIWSRLDSIKYSDYTISKSVNRDDTETAKYIDYGEGYLRYSNDGISYYSKKGNVIWNQTYEMQNPQIKICSDSIAVGDINGSSIYIFNQSGMVGSVDTSLSIVQVEIAKQGVVAAVLEDTNANYINLYSTDGEKIYTVKTTLAGDGYPLDISISDDATKLIASYVYVNGDSIKTNVVFYNFSEVGQNETERIVGGFNHYDSVIVPDVEFVNDTTAVAIGENVVSIYHIKEYPSLSKEIQIDSEIDRIFISDDYIGLVLKNSDSVDIYKMVVYDLSGKKKFEKTFNTQYSTIKFDGDSILMYNDKVFTLMNMHGKVQLTQNFDLPIESILSTGTRGDYVLISSKYIQNIRLK